MHSCRNRADAAMPTRRQSGIGRRLLAELVRRADDAEIYLTTLAGTTRFYAAEGFQTLERGDIPRCTVIFCLPSLLCMISAVAAVRSSVHSADNCSCAACPGHLMAEAAACRYRSLLFEYTAGTVVARIAAGQQLAVMRRRPSGTA
jgi:hypothetical protein